MMGFFQDLGGAVGSAFGLGGNKQEKWGKEAQDIAEMRARQIANQTPAEAAAAAGAAGAGLGEQMGRTAATAGSQAATQAARTAGVNKGQAAILGGQEAGRAFTQGQTTGQYAGMGNYNQAAGRQLTATGLEAQIGQGEQAGGRQQGQDFMGGISKLAGGIASAAGGGAGGAAAGLGEGGIVMEPTTAIVGDKGPEAVIPLDDMEKVKAILKTVYNSRKKKDKKNAEN
jgi:hypothetical protein